MNLRRPDGTTRPVGPGAPVFIVAELSANHAGSLARAHRLVEAAADAGADAIKLQTYRPRELAELRGGGICTTPPWEGVPLVELYEQAQTPWEWHRELFDHAHALGLLAFSSTFSAEATVFLVGLGVPCLKVAAREWSVRERLALPADLPVIYSIQPHESDSAVRADDVLLHCVSEYPPRCERQGLRRMVELSLFNSRLVGLSDHSLCIHTAVMAVAMGASIIEVHLMLDDADYETPPLDAGHSWRPRGFQQLVQAIRHAEATL